MEVQIGVAKINKYAVSESGDTLEIVERPNGGVSVVLADGQRSGKSAKMISNMVVRKVISLLAEGVRDGAAARAASDYLFTERGGRVQSTLNILSVDLISRTLVISRNNEVPIYYIRNEELVTLDDPSNSVGVYRNTRPSITEIPLEAGLTVAIFTDGLTHAGTRSGNYINIPEVFSSLCGEYPLREHAQLIVDGLMKAALEADDNRPVDDVSVVVLRVVNAREDKVRRMQVSIPLTR